MAILSKSCKPDNFKSHNSLKLNLTIILVLRLSFSDCEHFLESNLDDSIDSGNFSVRGYLHLICEDSSTHMHGLAVYVKEGLPFALDLHGMHPTFSLEGGLEILEKRWLGAEGVRNFYFGVCVWVVALSISYITHSKKHSNTNLIMQ